MKLTQENNGFSPVAIILETREDAQIMWDIAFRILKCTDRDAEYKMAVEISNWFSNEAKL